MKIDISDLDIIYISYDEPNCNELWEDLIEKVPWAKRVHKVKGFDSAHKEAAKLSETTRFVTVDADNIVDETFFDLELDIDTLKETDVLSWNGKNMINGLIYGNGNLKCWNKNLVLNMNTHENSNSEQTKIEFCWDINFIPMKNWYSYVYSNGSPYQAFRAGYREGVKMSLDQGKKLEASEFVSKIYFENLHRLMIWCCVGKDVNNGEWAIHGARKGVWDTIIGNIDIENIRDYDWFQDFWKSVFENETEKDSEFYRKDLCSKLNIDIPDLDEVGSRFFKKVNRL